MSVTDGEGVGLGLGLGRGVGEGLGRGVGLGVGFGRALTVTILFTGFAPRNRLLPACVAVTVVLPALKITSVEPLTLATLLLLLK